MVSEGVVATLDDFTLGDAASVVKILTDAGIARILLNPGPVELAGCPKVCFPQGAGGTGITFAMGIVGARNGEKKISLLYPDVPAAAGLPALEKAAIAANGAEQVNAIPIGGNVSDYTQFVVAAQKNGADGAVLALGDAQATQVLTAAQQLNSQLKFTGSTGTFSVDLLKQFPKVAESIVLTDSTPAPTADQSKFPGLKDFLADMNASGNPDLKTDKLRTQQLTPWLAVRALITVMKGTTDITAQSVLSAFSTAKDVDMDGIIKPWTPAFDNNHPFIKRAWPFYYISHFKNGKTDTDANPFNLVDAMSGKFVQAP